MKILAVSLVGSCFVEFLKENNFHIEAVCSNIVEEWHQHQWIYTLREEMSLKLFIKLVSSCLGLVL